MACEIIRTDGEVLYARISGIMSLADQQALQKAGGNLIEQLGTVSLLVTLQDFKGWEKAADWGDLGFMFGPGKKIKKIALIGDARWRDEAFAFVGKGIRSTQIEFFSPESAQEADSWIRS